MSVSESTARLDIDVLVQGWREYEAKSPTSIPIVKFAAKTDMGQVRENNEDKFEFYEPEEPGILATRGSLYAVADGVGGAQAGQIASELMLKRLISGYYNHPAADPQAALYETCAEVNDYLFSVSRTIPERSGMGTTLVGLVLIENQTIVVQIGDSRAYLLRDGLFRQVTVDHSWVEEQVRAGYMTREEAEKSPFRNVITRCVGANPTVTPELYAEETLPGDCWLLCTDGISGLIEQAELAQLVAHNSPSEAARQCIELANARGGNDNMTVFVISIRSLKAYSPAAAGVLPVSEMIYAEEIAEVEPVKKKRFSLFG